MNSRQSLYGDGSRFMGIVTAPVGLRITQQAHTLLAVTRAAGDQFGNGTAAGSMLVMRFPLSGSPKVRAHVWATGALATVDGLTTIQPTTRALVGQMATGAPGAGSTLSPMLNGVADNTPVTIGGTPATPNPSFIVGARGFGVGGDTFNGYLGDVFIIDRALTTLELAEFARWAKNRWGIS